MSPYRQIVLVGGLALAACSPSVQPEPSPGTVERFTDDIERRNADEASRVTEAADARATLRAEKAVRRIAASEQRRLGGSGPAAEADR